VDQLLLHLAKEVPTAVAIIYVVTYMARSARPRDEQYHENMQGLMKETHDRYESNASTCERRNERMVAAVDKNAERTIASIDKNSLALDELNRNLHKLNGGTKWTGGESSRG
jgi:hypothetical protein